jgi:hypothetical protein
MYATLSRSTRRSTARFSTRSGAVAPALQPDVRRRSWRG